MIARLSSTLRRRPTTGGQGFARIESEVAMDSEVVDLDPEATPMLDILKKARNMGRPARSNTHLHVSELIGKCIRRIAIVERLGLPASAQNLSLTDALTFAQGDAIHDTLRSRAMSGASNLVWGHWECACKTTSTQEPCLHSQVDPEETCPACHHHLTNYKEVPMFNDEYMIVGTPDFLIYIPESRALHVNELKSIAHDTWKDLVRPVPEHLIQALFYWYLMHGLGYRLTSRISLVYATKGWMFSGNPTKEFTFDAREHLKRLDPYIDEARRIKLARAGGALPKRICVSETATDAKKCDVCKSCFSGSENVKPVEVSVASALRRRTR